MRLNRSYFKSRGLSDEKVDFLERLVPLSRTISSWTKDKAHDREEPIPTKYGVFPSVILALCILRSIWGTHPVAQRRYEWVEKSPEGVEKKIWRHGNNLGRVYADRSWLERDRPYIKHSDGAIYKSYREESAFAVDFSDIISYRYSYKRLLLAEKLNEQIEAIAARAEHPETMKLSLGGIIYQLELYQYDSY